MPEETTGSNWTDPGFLRDARAWADARAADHGLVRIGEYEQSHVRTWATAMRADTDNGRMWFKAITRLLPHEAAVTHALSVWSPEYTLRVLASDASRNWLAMEDGGVTLRSLREHRPVSTACKLAHDYALLQRDLVSRTDEMLSMGVPDFRLAIVPEVFEDLAERMFSGEEILPVGAEIRTKLRGLSRAVERSARELISLGIPDTIQHDDLHWNNILVRDGRPVPFDWGDCSVSHPFLSMMVLMKGSAHVLEVSPDSSEIRRIRNAYLEPWNLALSDDDLDRVCSLTHGLACISRAQTWRRLLPVLPEEDRVQFGPYFADLLAEFAVGVTALHGADVVMH